MHHMYYDAEEILYEDVIYFNDRTINIIKVYDMWCYYICDILNIIGYTGAGNHIRMAETYSIEYVYIHGRKHHVYVSYEMAIHMLSMVIHRQRGKRAYKTEERIRKATEFRKWLSCHRIPLGYGLSIGGQDSAFINNTNNKGENIMDNTNTQQADTYRAEMLKKEHDRFEEKQAMPYGDMESMHQHFLDKMHETFIQKNTAYGSSFNDTFKEYGIISAATRISDKYNRFRTLAKDYGKGNIVCGDESIKDTLLDMANYCVLTLMAIEEGENNK